MADHGPCSVRLQVLFIAQRRMMRKPTRVSRVKQQRPRSRTLKEVHEKILEDLVFPTVSDTH